MYLPLGALTGNSPKNSLASAAIFTATAGARRIARHEAREQEHQSRNDKHREDTQGGCPPLPPPFPSSPLFTAIRHVFTTMTTTRYAHKTHVDTAAGIYYFDCVLMIGHFLKRSNPQANREMRQYLGTRPGFVPSPKNWARFFASLDPATDTAWHRIVRIDDLQPGDIIIKPAANPERPGHALVVARAPQHLENGNVSITIFDANSGPHGTNDTRNTDTRNELRDGKRSGLGIGVIELITTADGGFTNMKSTVGGNLTGLSVLIGRALSPCLGKP